MIKKILRWETHFSNFSCRFLNPNIICFNANLLDVRNLQEQVRKGFCFKNCSVRIYCSSDLQNLENSRPSVSSFKKHPITRIFLSHSSTEHKLPFEDSWLNYTFFFAVAIVILWQHYWSCCFCGSAVLPHFIAIVTTRIVRLWRICHS